jgi:alkanesulfonate monooxygenase SsuD/methylene tetrahydromethanopterin reductase-like flavin-dependent oxidoreductase (luciferase family)
MPATLIVSEHHGSKDGYIPSPALIIAAMAARTKTVRFSVAALIAPFHDPLRIAEDYSVLDNITRGRVDLIVAGGYAPSEFAMFDVPIKERPKRVTEAVKTLKAAFVGKPFEYRGRTVEVTPEPFRPGGSAVILGGASEGAARRAARIADGFVPSDPTWWKFYRDEMLKLGKADPGAAMPVGGSHVTVLTRDVETAWRVMAPYFLHDTNAYGAWKVAAGEDTRMTFMPMSIRCAPQTSITSLHQSRCQLAYHPLCGGMPIDLAWDGLELFEKDLLPAFR